MKKEEKLRNGAYDAEIQKNVNEPTLFNLDTLEVAGVEQKSEDSVQDAEIQANVDAYENPEPVEEDHPKWQDRRAISDVDHKLIHGFLKYITEYDAQDHEKIDMARFHEEYLYWAERNARALYYGKPKTFLCKKAFWELVETKIGEVPKSGEIHWATLQNQIFLNYSIKVLLDEFLWGIKTIKGPRLLVSNMLIDMAGLPDYFAHWCSHAKDIPLWRSGVSMWKFLADRELFWDRLKQKGLDLPQSGLMPQGDLWQKITDAYPKKPIKY